MTGRIGEKLSFQSDYSSAREVEMAQREAPALQMTASNLENRYNCSSCCWLLGGYSGSAGVGGCLSKRIERTGGATGKFLIPGIPWTKSD